MAVITAYMLSDLAKYIDQKVASADYTIGGTTRNIAIRRSIVSDNTVKKHVYLTTKDPVGTVTRVRLKDKDGNILAQLTGSEVHEKNTGRLFEFSFSVKEG
ncbi:hypothetical protein [Sporosarcina sp. ITBMC105]